MNNPVKSPKHNEAMFHIKSLLVEFSVYIFENHVDLHFPK